MNNMVVQSLKEIYVKERRNYLALKEKYLERHPLVLEQKAKLEAAAMDLKREVNNVLAAKEAKYKEIRDNEKQIASALQSAKNEALELNKRQVSYQRLKRNQQLPK